ADMTGKLAPFRRLLRIERIHAIKVRGAGVQPLAVDSQMPVLADLDFLPTQTHEPLDVKLISRNVPISRLYPPFLGNAGGRKTDDLAGFRPAKFIGQPVHE